MNTKYILIVITLLTSLCVTVSAQTNVPRGWMDGGGESPIFPAAVDNGYIGKQVAIGTNTAVVGMALTVKGTATITHKLAVGTTTISATSALNVAGTVTATGFVGDASGLTNVAGAGGDMAAATYDPQTIAGDAFDLNLHTGSLAGIAPPFIAQNSGTGTGITLVGTSTFPSGAWNSNGSISIGTTTANAYTNLHIYGDNKILRIGSSKQDGDNFSSSIELAEHTNADGSFRDGGLIKNFSDNGSERLSLHTYVDNTDMGGIDIKKSTGYVGVGTNTPATALHVVGTVTATSYIGKWSPRIVSMADGTSFTPTADTADINTHINTQAMGSITANAPTGSPSDGQKLILRLKTTNVQTYNWNAAYRFSASNGTVTVTSGADLTDYIGLMYNSTDSTWDVVSTSMGY